MDERAGKKEKLAPQNWSTSFWRLGLLLCVCFRVPPCRVVCALALLPPPHLGIIVPPQKKDTNEKGPSWLYCIAFHYLLIELHKPTYIYTYALDSVHQKEWTLLHPGRKGTNNKKREREPLCHTTRQEGQVLVGRAWPGFFLPHIHSRHAIASKI